ncbi:MmgE/PrpD family protein [Georgenia yuyongxinii]|uniref:MmgE/PrpD family protein n=1 Tax=Georgenia yuyongxinii TaxID=2589797 RepID=A0A5B8C3C5_9MICO|nr:MmgE/PrpD family protein [Georgenia yuyongxinii]QDC23775.1 MmgE/PrpD family protein [Georgenia yuyongxinii]
MQTRNIAPRGKSYSQAFAEFITLLEYEEIPEPVISRAKELILDSFGVAVAAVPQKFFRRAQRAVAELESGSAGGSSVIGLSRRHLLRDAAHLNGILLHGLDFDDTHLGAILHPSAPLLAAALPLGEEMGSSGKELLVAYVAGVEVLARLGEAASGEFHAHGFHPTGVVGAFGAAMVAARLKGGSAATVADAQGLVGTMAAGTLQFLTDGTWTKRSHAGWAAVCGITAAAYARSGFAAPLEVYEGKHGLYATHADRQAGPHIPDVASLGSQWKLLEVTTKPYPACHFTHAYIRTVRRMMDAGSFTADEVAEIHTTVSDVAAAIVMEPIEDKRTVTTAYGAQFSLPYVLAASIVQGGNFTLGEIEDEVLKDPRIRDLAARVHRADAGDGASVDDFCGDVEIVLKDGRRLVGETVAAAVDESAELMEKYAANAGPALGPDRALELRTAVLGLEDVGSIAELMALTQMVGDGAREGLVPAGRS